MVDKQTFKLANKLWDYHHVNQSLEKSDCILVLGSHDLRVAERGAELFLQGLAPYIIFSGGLGNFTKEIWDESEADKFATVAMNMGVPRDAILIENRSTNKKLPVFTESFFGTAGGIRTREVFRPGDFKSPVYTTPPPRQNVAQKYQKYAH